jgi:hypothetical protein
VNIEVERLVVFSILMGSSKGIADKSPDYILEELKAVNTCKSEHQLLSLLGLKTGRDTTSGYRGGEE